MRSLFFVLLLALILAVGPASAQSTAVVVSSCGTPPQSYVAGQFVSMTVDTNGNLCSSASGGGGSSVTVQNLAVGAAHLSTSQVSVANTATQIVAARIGTSGTGRVAVTVVNTGAVAVYLGATSGVTTSTGTLLPAVAGASVTINTTSAVYGIVATGTETVTEFETY